MTREVAIRKIAEGLYELADALFAESAVAEAAAPVTAAPSAIPDSGRMVPDSVYEELAEKIFPEAEEVGSLAVCPKHRKPYVEGTYGPYCTQLSDDPAWANRKGYCRITPKNAAAWLRIQAA